MEWTQSFPCRPAASERHALLDDLHDVGVRLEVVDERRGEETQGRYSFNSTTVTPPPPLSDAAGPKLSTNGCVFSQSAIARRS
jgi:hypothetical protein